LIPVLDTMALEDLELEGNKGSYGKERMWGAVS
jgi:hypothetical protein